MKKSKIITLIIITIFLIMNFTPIVNLNYKSCWVQRIHLYNKNSDSFLKELAQNPTSNHPEDITTVIPGLKTINWILWDEVGPGKYRVLANDTNDNIYVWQNWQNWQNNTELKVPINKSSPGTYKYIIEYNNSAGLMGVSDIVIVTINIPSHQALWNKRISQEEFRAVSISGNGQYIAAGTYSNNPKIYLFNKNSSTEEWIYNAEKCVMSIAISTDSQYIVAGTSTGGGKVILFKRNSSIPLWNYSHTDGFHAVDISADGQYIFAGCYDHRVYLFNKTSPIPLWNFTTDEWITAVGISADGMYMTATDGAKFYLFNRTSSTPIWTYDTGWSEATIDISANGQYVVAGSWDTKVYLFNNTSSTPIWTYSTGGLGVHVEDVDISADGQYIIAGCNDNNFYLFNRASSDPLWKYSAADEVVHTVISADGQYIIIGCNDGYIYYFNRSYSSPLWYYSTGTTIRSIDISTHGEYIPVGCMVYRIYLFYFKSIPYSNQPNDIITSNIGYETIDWTLSDEWDPGMYRIWVNDTNDNYYIWQNWQDWGNGVNLQVPINRTALGTFNYTIEYNNSVAEFGIPDSVKVTIFQGPASNHPTDFTTLIRGSETINWVIRDHIGPGKYRVWANDTNGNYYIWKNWADWTNNSNLQIPINRTTIGVFNYTIEYNNSIGQVGNPDTVVVTIVPLINKPIWNYTTGNINAKIAISHDSQYIAFIDQSQNLFLFNKTGPVELWNYSFSENAYCLDISADGMYIAIGGSDNKVYLFNRTSSTPMWSYTTGDTIHGIAISANGQYIAAASYDNKIYLFNKNSSTPLWNYTTGWFAYSVGISADGQYITAGSEDNNVYLFNRTSSIPIWIFNSGSYVMASEISADGEYIVAANGNDYIYLFHKNSSTPLWSYRMGSDSWTLSISEDGQYIAAGSYDDNIYFFNRTSSIPLWSYTTDGNVISVAISQNGEYVTAGSKDKKVYLFNRTDPNPQWWFETNGTPYVAISQSGEYIASANSDTNIYFFYYSDLPFSNHPDDITTPLTGTELISWILQDNEGPGKYRVWVNDTNGGYYIWRDWTDWANGDNLKIQINRTCAGLFNYTIEFNNSEGIFGTPDTVMVNIVNPPTSNYPNDIFTSAIGSETINWILYDDLGPGQYRVWANDTNGNYYVWRPWSPWTNNTNLEIAINRSAPGIFNYTIEYYDNQNELGMPDTVIVNISNTKPSSNHPEDIITSISGSETINWILYDDFGSGQYRVWANDSNGNYYIWRPWSPWINNTNLEIAINRSALGIFNYTIEYYDNQNELGAPDTVIVNISNLKPFSNHPEDIITSISGSETINWTLYDDFGSGQYRVWANDTDGNYYVIKDWTIWYNNSVLNVSINRTTVGIYNYTIEYYDNNSQYGNPDTVIVTILGNNGEKQKLNEGLNNIYLIDDEGSMWINLTVNVSSETNITLTSNKSQPTGFSDIENGIIYFMIDLENSSTLIQITIRFYYDELLLEDIKEQDLIIYYYNETLNSWEQLNGTINQIENYIEISLNHLSKFVIAPRIFKAHEEIALFIPLSNDNITLLFLIVIGIITVAGILIYEFKIRRIKEKKNVKKLKQIQK
ncbi:MAG: WD40 repeat domain-containing protein [Candidatus Helarchaeota archaeon]